MAQGVVCGGNDIKNVTWIIIITSIIASCLSLIRCTQLVMKNESEEAVSEE